MLGPVGGRPGLRCLLVSYFFATSLRCQASTVAGVTGEDLSPALAGHEPCQRGKPDAVHRLVSHLADVAAQHRIFVPEYQQFSILRQVPAEQQERQTEYTACQQVDHL